MQNTRGEWLSAVKRLYNRKNFTNYEKAAEAVRKLGYPGFYSNATILDAYPGAGVFSAALCNEIKPAKQILLEPFQGYNKFLATMASDKVQVENLDPFRWATFTSLFENGSLKVETQDRSHVHNQLLFTANLTHPQGEQLTAQYLNCITNQSWLQKFGRVRLLLWMRASVAEKLVAGPGDLGRHRLAVQCESCCEARVVFHERATPPKKKGTYPEVLQTPLLPLDSRTDISAKTHVPVSLVELTPHEKQIEHVDEFEYVIKMLFILRSTPLEQGLESLGPGARDDLGPQLQDILHKCPTDLTLEDFVRITDAFYRWPFKPDILFDFYEEQMMGTGSNELR